jgi:hypothetical protein
VVKSYLGLLTLGKSDFEAIEAFRRDRFFQEALTIGQVPGSVWLRQQLETHAAVLREHTDDWSVRLIRQSEAPITAENGFVCLDFDTFVMDNSGTKKECVGRTYQGVDGYTPIATYLGNEGWCLGLELRPGVQHSALETHYFLERLPSGKFDCNDLILHLGMLAYNCLRLIGQLGLTGELAPVRHPAKRRRIKTVLQELMYRAAQFIRKARQRILDFGRSCPVVAVFRAVQEDLLTAGRSP